MVRHYLLTGAISPAPRGVVEAAAPAALIAARHLPTPHLAGVEATASGAVDLAPIAMTADQDLPAAKSAQEEAAAVVVIEVAPVLDAPGNPWTRSASGAIMPRQSCSGTVRARRRVKRSGSVGAAPGPMIDRNCSARGAVLSALERYPKRLPTPPTRGLTRWVHRESPVPCASPRYDRAPLRGRGPLSGQPSTLIKTMRPPDKRGF